MRSPIRLPYLPYSLYALRRPAILARDTGEEIRVCGRYYAYMNIYKPGRELREAPSGPIRGPHVGRV